MVFFVLKQAFKFLGKLPGKMTKELAKRYLNIGRFAFNRKQANIFSKLRKQYPTGTGFIILPMDMEYMEAGKLKAEHRYREQMQQLADIKKSHPDHAYPFVFADPRRFVEVSQEINYVEGDQPYFNYSVNEGKRVVLGDCFIRELIETSHLSGFKIYPALGYYPFDYRLLPLWKYAADKGLPILTHCIRGTIFYRGNKDKAWDYHPVFEEARDERDYKPLLLPQKKNMDFSINFTHPLNYLCLLEEKLLRIVVRDAIPYDATLQDVFGYKDEYTPLQRDLSHLKLCFGHYGGDDEWKRYFELDRFAHSNQFTQNPLEGIDFMHTSEGAPSKGKLEQIWKFTDWYSIISSLMLQYPNVYSDISYILHDSEGLLPLLKETLQNEKLRHKVLYGTDFYVVRNHKSDKNLLADMRGGLSEEEFDLIARYNPQQFLQSIG